MDQPSGDLVMTGGYRGQISFGGTSTTADDRDVFVTRVGGKDATHRWTRTISSASTDTGSAIAIYGERVIVGGIFSETLVLGLDVLVAPTEPTNPQPNTLVATLDLETGDPIWARGDGDEQRQLLNALSVDQQGNIIMAGAFHGTLNYGNFGDELDAGVENDALNGDAFVAKLDPDGRHLWSVGLGDSSPQAAVAVISSEADDIYVAGSFAGSITIGQTSLTSSTVEFDAFVLKFDSDGTLRWAQQFGAAGRDEATALALDRDGNLLVAGAFTDTVDFGATVLTSLAAEDAFLLKLRANGSPMWATRMGGGGRDQAVALAPTTTGDIAVAFETTGGAQGPLGDTTGFGGSDVGLAVLSPGGALKWHALFGDGSDEAPKAIARGAEGGIVLGGDFRGSISLGGSELQSAREPNLAPSMDIFLAELAL